MNLEMIANTQQYRKSYIFSSFKVLGFWHKKEPKKSVGKNSEICDSLKRDLTELTYVKRLQSEQLNHLLCCLSSCVEANLVVCSSRC